MFVHEALSIWFLSRGVVVLGLTGGLHVQGHVHVGHVKLTLHTVQGYGQGHEQGCDQGIRGQVMDRVTVGFDENHSRVRVSDHSMLTLTLTIMQRYRMLAYAHSDKASAPDPEPKLDYTHTHTPDSAGSLQLFDMALARTKEITPPLPNKRESGVGLYCLS